MYAGNTYDSSADYWKLMENGNLAYDGDGWLKDSNGNQISDDNGEPIGANGVEGGLANILGMSSAEAQAILNSSGFSSDGAADRPWKTSKNENKEITLGNALYAQKYNELLTQHNTLNIYNQMVENGLMDYTSIDYSVVQGDGNTWNGRLPQVNYIPYDEWKANNFISDVSTGMISLQKPVNGKESSPAGIRNNPITNEPNSFHTGIDWQVKEGTPFTPFADGKIFDISYTSATGNALILQHNISYTFKGAEITSSYYTSYFHLQTNASGGVNTPYSIGSIVLANNVAGYSGNTGSQTTGPHLHGGMYFSSVQNNPYANWLSMQNKIEKPKEFK